MQYLMQSGKREFLYFLSGPRLAISPARMQNENNRYTNTYFSESQKQMAANIQGQLTYEIDALTSGQQIPFPNSGLGTVNHFSICAKTGRVLLWSNPMPHRSGGTINRTPPRDIIAVDVTVQIHGNHAKIADASLYKTLNVPQSLGIDALIQIGNIGIIGKYHFREGIFSLSSEAGKHCFRLSENLQSAMNKLSEARSH